MEFVVYPLLPETPWPIVAISVLGTIFIVFVRSVLPKRSEDRLRWWHDFWNRPK
jgi:hypothetical protein